MKKITDPNQVEQWKKESKIDQFFDTEGLEFYICEYSAGELLCSPNESLTDIHFIVRGKVRIYNIHEDGSLSSISLESEPVILGDIEYVIENFATLFVEAHTEVVSLVLPVSRYRDKLQKDLRFLHMLLSSIAHKFAMFAPMHNQNTSVEERLLMYMETFCADGILMNVEEATMQLRCSRRQLQRVLKSLCESGRIGKIKKGTYRLISAQEY